MEDNTFDLTTILAKSNILIHYSDLFENNCDSVDKTTDVIRRIA